MRTRTRLDTALLVDSTQLDLTRSMPTYRAVGGVPDLAGPHETVIVRASAVSSNFQPRRDLKLAGISVLRPPLFIGPTPSAAETDPTTASGKRWRMLHPTST